MAMPNITREAHITREAYITFRVSGTHRYPLPAVFAGSPRKRQNPYEDFTFSYGLFLIIERSVRLRLFYAHDMEPGFGEDIMARFKKYAAFSSPSSTDIRLSSCSIDITLS